MSASAPATAVESPDNTPTRTRTSRDGGVAAAGREAVTSTSAAVPSATEGVSTVKVIRLSSSMMDR